MKNNAFTPYRPHIVSLDDLATIRNTDEYEPPYWISRQPPREVLGALLEQFSGIYLDHDLVARVELGYRQTQHPLPPAVRDWPADRLNALLAAILQMELDGQSDLHIAAAIAELTLKNPLQEAA